MGPIPSLITKLADPVVQSEPGLSPSPGSPSPGSPSPGSPSPGSLLQASTKPLLHATSGDTRSTILFPMSLISTQVCL
ncbi:MAG: hypothetical protein DRR42_26775 [Gammaproteobacteria bacterium]|nr:MAG: hypothetical protein DRR42_26775 [Gammaproteobacteria bacterium]